MKKVHFFVTLFLVVALGFAVSCQAGVTVSIKADVSKEAVVGTALADFTFDIETTGEFLQTAVDKELTVKGLDAFNGTEASDKATATAKISALGNADATTGKVTTATVTVSGFTAKKEAKGNLTFAIPKVESGSAPTILKDVTGEVTLSGKTVTIDAKAAPQPAEKRDVKAPQADGSVTNSGGNISGQVSFALEGATWKDAANDKENIQFDPEIGEMVTSTIDELKTVLTLSFEGQDADGILSDGTVSFDIKGLIDVDETHKIPDGDLKCFLEIK